MVHLASPGAAGLGRGAGRQRTRDRLGGRVPDRPVGLSLHRYRLGAAAPALWAALRQLHNQADLTLVPSSATAYQLRRHGIGPLARWARGVDGHQFDPARRDERRRIELLGAGRAADPTRSGAPGDPGRTGVADGLLVGFVGRLAAEKRIELLEPVTRLPGVGTVIVGDGPRGGRAAPAAAAGPLHRPAAR